jgi:hypothetical protein
MKNAVRLVFINAILEAAIVKSMISCNEIAPKNCQSCFVCDIVEYAAAFELSRIGY